MMRLLHEMQPAHMLPQLGIVVANVTDSISNVTSVLYSMHQNAYNIVSNNGSDRPGEYGAAQDEDSNLVGGSVGSDISSGVGDDAVGRQKEFVFDRTDVRIVFVTLYSLVFCCCFFGEFQITWGFFYSYLKANCITSEKFNW